MTRAGRRCGGGRRGGPTGPGALVATAVLVAGVRLVDAVLPDDPPAPRAADDPAEVLARLRRLAALTTVLALSGWAGRAVAARLTGPGRTAPRA